MSTPITRRGFVRSTLAAGAVAGLGDFAFLDNLPAAGAEGDKVTPKTVQFGPDIEPLVRLIEDTDRAKVLAAVAEQIRKGTSYQRLLSAVFLAGVRGIQPRPVGFKFHAVLVINSAHLASLAAPDNDRWLPLFWAVDNFKGSQARNKAEGDWHMAPVDNSKLPPSWKAKERFIEAMDNWDEAATDRAVAALARTASPGEIIELFWRFGCRDFRDIGHKAIYAANSWRTLQAIGWQHAEPVLRSLAYAMLEHRESGNPAKSDYEPDRPYRANLKRVAKMGPLAKATIHSREAGERLRDELRTSSWDDACETVASMVKAGIKPECVWDGLFLTAGELLMRQPGIVGIHCVTSANALHYAYQATASDETRKLLMLQAAAFLVMFRQAMSGRGLNKNDLLALEPAEVKGDALQSIDEIFRDVSKDRLLAARKTLAFVEKDPARVPELMTAARRLIFTKGRDSHDYKFSSAALEDYYHLTPAWRARYAAASMFNLHGSGDRDNGLMERTKAALAKG